ncbi:hypothetical protein L7F22_000125 [Adiantum nelumboides]|nr:hypothetical protein [Adiantum nelumboides]
MSALMEIQGDAKWLDQVLKMMRYSKIWILQVGAKEPEWRRVSKCASSLNRSSTAAAFFSARYVDLNLSKSYTEIVRLSLLRSACEKSSMDVLPASLNHVSQQAYVSELLSFSLDRLHKEPELLRVDSEKIRRQMQDLAVGHYRAFIVAAEALHSIGEEMTSVDKHLETLV